MNVLDLVRERTKDELVLTHPEDIAKLRVWYCKYRSICRIRDCSNLNELVVAGIPDSSLDFLSCLSKLKYLKVLHFPNIKNIAPIACLKELEVLSLSTIPSWDSSGKRQIIDSLKPIVGLKKLKHLELFGVCTDDKSLVELENSTSLLTVRISGYPKKEQDRFRLTTKYLDRFVPESSFD